MTMHDPESRFPAFDKLQADLKSEWLREVARWYESDIQLGIKDGLLPLAEPLLKVLPEPEREEASKVLDSIHSFYKTTMPHAFDRAGKAQCEAERQTVNSEEFTKHPQADATLVGKNAAGNEDSLQATIAVPRVDGYAVRRVLGKGGMGVVYLAEQVGIGRLVALKMIRSGIHSAPDYIERLFSEAKAVGKLRHDNIVQIYDIDPKAVQPFLAFEYLEGGTLLQKINQQPMDPNEAVGILEPIARAIAYAHSKKIIHRDVKPSNILLTVDGVPKLTDFGLAKDLELERQLSLSGEILGTPNYMAPEQASGDEAIGPAADIYALGAVLYCALTGRPPFNGAKTNEVLLQLLSKDPVAPRVLQANVPKDLETICMKCLEKSPSARYSTAEDLADDLKRFLNNEPITARPVGKVERVIRWSKRKPTLASLVATLILLTATLAIGGPISAISIYGEKLKTEEARKDSEKNAQLAQHAKGVSEQQAAIAKKNEEVAARNAEAAQVQQKNTVDALKSLVFEVQARMSDDPRFLELRQQLLKVAIDGLDRMKEAGGDVSNQNMIAATIERRLGDVNAELGRAKQAMENYRKCLAIVLELDKTNDLKYRNRNLATIYEQLGLTSKKLGDYAAAKENFLIALEYRRSATKEEPENLEFSRDIATTLGLLGQLAQSQGKLDDAVDYLKQSQVIRDQALMREPSKLNYQIESLGAKWQLAEVDYQLLDYDTALASMQECLVGLQELSKQHPGDMNLYQNAALAGKDYALMLLYQNRIEESRNVIASATEQMEAIRPELTNSMRFLDRIGGFHYLAAIIHLHADDQHTSRIHLERCFQGARQLIDVEPKNTNFLIGYLTVAARLDKLNDAGEYIKRLKALDALDCGLKFEVACCYAQIALSLTRLPAQLSDTNAEHFEELAIDILQQSVAEGFNRQADLKFHLDIAPIRERMVSTIHNEAPRLD